MDLELEFDFSEESMFGKAHLNLKPYASEQNKLILDAKGLIVESIVMDKKELSFDNDNKYLYIDLFRTIKPEENFDITITYSTNSRKNQNLSKSGNRGLYFVNTKKLNPDKPTQIWTASKEELASVWFPTLDQPNQKFTQSIQLTVPEEFKTLSNGKLANQTVIEGKRTDVWVLDKPHSPHMSFFAIGEFSLGTAEKSDIRFNNFVHLSYGSLSDELFKNTPLITAYFENILDYKYPWKELNQVVLEDFVYEGLESTNTNSFGTDAYQILEQLNDVNLIEDEIAALVFKQWFGGLVSPESWSNSLLSDGFGKYGTYLWRNHHYGDDAGILYLQKLKEDYFSGGVDNEDSKGAYALHMLRKQIGDPLFFSGLKLYLESFAYDKAEIDQLRLCFEKVTGEDLSWFFRQWFEQSNAPILQVNIDFNIIDQTFSLTFKQLGDVFQFPLEFTIYQGKTNQIFSIWMNQREQTITLPYEEAPDLIEVNSKLNALVEISQNQTQRQYMYQSVYSTSTIKRISALEYLKDKQDQSDIYKIFAKSTMDSNDNIAIFALNEINLSDKYSKRNTIKGIENTATNKKVSNERRAAAIELLGKLVNPEYYSVFDQGMQSTSLSIISSSLTAMYYINQDRAFEKASSLPVQAKKGIAFPLVDRYIKDKTTEEMPFVANYLIYGMYFIRDKEMKETYENGFQWVIKSNNEDAIKNLCEDIVDKSTEYASYGFKDVGIDLLRQIISEQYKLDYDNRDNIVNIVSASLDELIIN